MKRAWQPGDVAMLAAYGEVRVVIRTDDPHPGWVSCTGFLADRSNFTPRPLVVIDPTDREQVERLLVAALAQNDPLHPDGSGIADALREFADPKPPKPEEPTGLGAVVEDSAGVRWIKIDRHAGCNDWTKIGAPSHRDSQQATGVSVRWEFADIDAVKVLSEGVTP